MIDYLFLCPPPPPPPSQAQLVRELKAGGGPKDQVDQEVERLVKLKKRLGLEPANKKKGKKK